MSEKLLIDLGSEVCVGKSLSVSVEKVSVEQFIVTVLRLTYPGQTLHRGL